jgi:hypothetical protein
MLAPHTQITGWSPALLKLAIHLSVAAYHDNFSAFHGKILYSSLHVDFERPLYSVYLLDNALWVINRGARLPQLCRIQ